MIGTQERAYFLTTKPRPSPEAVEEMRAEVLAPYGQGVELRADESCAHYTIRGRTPHEKARRVAAERDRKRAAGAVVAKVQRVTDVAFPCGEAWDL